MQNWLKFLTFSPLSPSHLIKYVKKHVHLIKYVKNMFEVLNIGKKVTNYTVWMSFATRS
jgi:hypothetical protein